MKVALIHDWLTGMRGGERCLQAFLKLYPEADIYTLLHVPGSTRKDIDLRVKGTSFLQKLPGVRRYYRLLLPLYPFAIKRFRLDGYDLVISLSHAAAKNVRVPKGTRHICYCFTPMRYIWDQARRYLGHLMTALWPIVWLLRRWDLNGARRVDTFVGISDFVSARIRRFYGRRSLVIYPPVDTSWIEPCKEFRKGQAFLLAGALVPYKRAELAVKAFNVLGEPLWVVGKGPEESKLRSIAKSNIHFFGHVSDDELAGLYSSCRALIFPGVEDFGLIPVECMAAGRPVIGLYKGGLRETIVGLKPWDEKYNSALDRSSITGVFIEQGIKNAKESSRHREDRELEALISAVRYFTAREEAIAPEGCIKQALQFSPQRFYESWGKVAPVQHLEVRQAMVA